MEEKEDIQEIQTKIKIKSYHEQTFEWPTSGQHILGQYDDETIIVYQAFNEKIAKWAVENQYFGGDDYSTTRMTWIKTNFLWMQYRSGWSSKKNQTNTLAIWIKRSFFEEILKHHFFKKESELRGSVRLQWDPDHRPNGDKCKRRALQIGMKGELMKEFLKKDGAIVKIEDISNFCKNQYDDNVKDKDVWKELMTPIEKEYFIKDENLMKLVLEYDNNHGKFK
jgi:hypothetical protein